MGGLLQVVCACCCTMPAAAMQLLVNLQAAVTSPSGEQIAATTLAVVPG
jgi:hypothetical protein